MKINLWDGFWKVEIDWKAVVGIGIIVLGYALIIVNDINIFYLLFRYPLVK